MHNCVVSQVVSQGFAKVLSVCGPLEVSKDPKEVLRWQVAECVGVGDDATFVEVDVQPNLVESC